MFYLIWALFFGAHLFGEEPLALYLTWSQDPTSTMSVHWVSEKEARQTVVEYRKLGQREWQKKWGQDRPFPQSRWIIHGVELEGLRPGSLYEYRVEGSRKIGKFSTMPSTLEEPLRFVLGGDLYHSKTLYSETCLQAASQDPQFAVLGGDLAYATSKYGLLGENATRWLDWLSIWCDTMVTPEGRTIPMVAIIGNHEVMGRYHMKPKNAPVFYALFPHLKNEGYRALDFGQYLSLFLLDSGHTHPIEGKQSSWLEKALRDRRNVLHRFAVYHVPAWPSVRRETKPIIQSVRNHWVPIFESGGVHWAFEHHDHAYKRTYPIKGGQVHPDGVVYFGDGAWGVYPRVPVIHEPRWYIAKLERQRHFFLVELKDDQRFIEAISGTGKIIDEYLQPVEE